jgi:hypothetical protein
VAEIPEGFNPTVGGYLYLGSVAEIPEGFNPTVGGYLYLGSGRKYIGNNVDKIYIMQWKNGKYALIDGVFGEIVKTKTNFFKMRKINGDVFYVVSDGNGKYAHGETVEEARNDLVFKITNRNKDSYRDHTLKTVMEYSDAICCYRVITGACSFGVKEFVRTILNNEPKEQYSIMEIIELTDGQYGHDTFKKFFANK